MTAPLLDSVEINPPGTPTACIIWLHGLGANGHDFTPLVPQLGIVQSHGVRVVLPHAPARAVTINGGLVMPAWYDIRAMDLRHGEDVAGIRQSERQIVALIERELESGIDARRLFLAGFSQGGAIALHTGLRYGHALGGILALSTYLPLSGRLASEAATANRALPILLAHGSADPVVPLVLAQQTRRLLVDLGYPVEWHLYPMLHAVCPDEVGDIRHWLQMRLAD